MLATKLLEYSRLTFFLGIQRRKLHENQISNRTNVRRSRKPNGNPEWTIQRQSHIGNSGYTAHRTKTNKAKKKKQHTYITIQKTENMNKTDPINKPRVNPGVREGYRFLSRTRLPPCYSHMQDMLGTNICK